MKGMKYNCMSDTKHVLNLKFLVLHRLVLLVNTLTEQTENAKFRYMIYSKNVDNGSVAWHGICLTMVLDGTTSYH